MGTRGLPGVASWGASLFPCLPPRRDLLGEKFPGRAALSSSTSGPPPPPAAALPIQTPPGGVRNSPTNPQSRFLHGESHEAFSSPSPAVVAARRSSDYREQVLPDSRGLSGTMEMIR
jgi:hypothetical protein